MLKKADEKGPRCGTLSAYYCRELDGLGAKIGSVDTAFILIHPDHKIVVEAYDDPKVQRA